MNVRFLVLVPFWVMCPVWGWGAAVGLDSRDLETERLLSARSAMEVSRAALDSQDLRESRAACEAELRSASLIPAHCFRVLALERTDALAPPAVRAQLERRCRLKAREASNLGALEAALLTKWLSHECESAVRSRISEITYMISDRSPFELFRRRLGAGTRPSF